MTEPTSIPTTAASAAPGASGETVGVSPEAGALPAEPSVVRLVDEAIHAVDEAGCVRFIVDTLAAGAGGWVITVNTDILRRLRRDRAFREMAAQATLRVPDGMPLLWAASLQKTPLPGRVAGSNLIDSLTEAVAEAGHSVFFLGGDEGTAEGTADVLRGRYPNLRVAGTYCPPRGFEDDPEAMERLRQALVAAQPGVVYVALGCPKQERVIGRLRGQLPAAWWVGVGISFSFMSGRVRRAPGWMQRAGLEWVFRLMQEPGRLVRRYLIDDLPYGFYLLGAALRHRWRRTGPESGQNGRAKARN